MQAERDRHTAPPHPHVHPTRPRPPRRGRQEAELRARLRALRAAGARLVETADADRRRIERDLHDGAQQRLCSLLLRVRIARRAAAPADPAVAVLLDTIEAELTGVLADLRGLVAGILPPVLTDHGLRAAAEVLAGRFPLPVALGELPAERLPRAVEVAAYFVIAEALANVAKHAEAGAVAIAVTRTRSALRVEVADDGRGGARLADGTGLRGLADRVGALGGTLACDSPRGAGTRLVAELPCPS